MSPARLGQTPSLIWKTLELIRRKLWVYRIRLNDPLKNNKAQNLHDQQFLPQILKLMLQIRKMIQAMKRFPHYHNNLFII